MAYDTQTHDFVATRTDRFGDAVARLMQWYARWTIYRRTRDELMALGDRDLADLGLVRGDVERIARQAAAGVRSQVGA